MSRGSSEEWQRRKWYLVRSLFENLPALSPIPETQEQPDLIRSTDTSGSSSPLPDLIIEKEPNRHDEPEEYYQELQQKVLIIYKELFINGDCSDTAYNTETISDAGVVADGPTGLFNNSSNTSSTPTSSHQVIVTQAEVYQTGRSAVSDQEAGSTFVDIQHHSTDTTVTSNFTNESPSNSQEADMELDDLESAASGSLDEPEVMRRVGVTNKSMESLRASNDGRHFSADVSHESVLKVAGEMEQVEESSNDFSAILGTTSTPKHIIGTPERNESNDREYGHNRSSNRSEISSDDSFRVSSPKRRKLENVATQTSFSTSDEEYDWEEIKSRLFVGNPRIYKLCSCRDHICR